MKSEELMQKEKQTSRSTRLGKVMFPIMEEELFKRFIDKKKEGKQVRDGGLIHNQNKSWLRHILSMLKLSFKMSVRWFVGFCQRNKILLQRKTHVSHQNPNKLRKSLSEVSAKTSRGKAYILQGTYCHLCGSNTVAFYSWWQERT